MDLIIEHKLAWSRPRHPDWTAFNRRVGVKWGTFAQRLARARLLCLRRHEVTAHWLALAALVTAWPGGAAHEGRFHRRRGVPGAIRRLASGAWRVS